MSSGGGGALPGPGELVVFDHERVNSHVLSGLRLLKLTSVGSVFERCRFEELHVKDAALGAGMEMSVYSDCSFDGSRMSLPAGGFARFERCSFRNVMLDNWGTDYVELIDCVFSGVIRTTVFWGSPPLTARHRYESNLQWLGRQGRPVPAGYPELALRTANDFHGNDFSSVDLIDVGFRRQVDLSRQLLPSGPEYLYLSDARESISFALSALDKRDQGEPEVAARRFLQRLLDRELDGGQRQLLLHQTDFARRGTMKPGVTLAFSLLGGAERPTGASGDDQGS